MESIEKLFNGVSIVVGLTGGLLAKILGGYDILLEAVFCLVVLDYITGLIKGWYLKKLSSEIGFKGILKKITIFVVIAVSVVMQELMGEAVPIREIVIMFFICNESLSLLENAAVMVPVPPVLKKTLLQLRKKTEFEDDDKE